MKKTDLRFVAVTYLPTLSGIQFSNTRVHRITFYDPERPEGIDNCTKD